MINATPSPKSTSTSILGETVIPLRRLQGIRRAELARITRAVQQAMAAELMHFATTKPVVESAQQAMRSGDVLLARDAVEAAQAKLNTGHVVQSATLPRVARPGERGFVGPIAPALSGAEYRPTVARSALGMLELTDSIGIRLLDGSPVMLSDISLGQAVRQDKAAEATERKAQAKELRATRRQARQYAKDAAGLRNWLLRASGRTAVQLYCADWLPFGQQYEIDLPCLSMLSPADCLTSVGASMAASFLASQPINDRLADYVSAVAMQASGRAVRMIGGGYRRDRKSSVMPPTVSATSREEARESAVEAIGIALGAYFVRLGEDWEWAAKAMRLLPPVGSAWLSTTPGGKARRYLYSVAFGAAYDSLTAIAEGYSSRNGRFFLTELTEWGRDVDSTMDNDSGATTGFIAPTELVSRFTFEPPTDRQDQFADARKLAWQRLGCRARNQWPTEVNARRQEKGKIRRYAVIASLLRGELAPAALKRSGLGDSWLVNGKLRELVQSFGMRSASPFMPASVEQA
jgi:hypothetical protein